MNKQEQSDPIRTAENFIEERSYAQALEILKSSDEKDEIYTTILTGYCLYKADKSEEAIVEFCKVLDTGALALNVLFLRANCYIETGRYSEAKEDFLKVIDIDSSVFDAHVGLGVVYECEGDIGSAISCYRQALLLNKESTVATRRLAAIDSE